MKNVKAFRGVADEFLESASAAAIAAVTEVMVQYIALSATEEDFAIEDDEDAKTAKRGGRGRGRSSGDIDELENLVVDEDEDEKPARGRGRPAKEVEEVNSEDGDDLDGDDLPELEKANDFDAFMEEIGAFTFESEVGIREINARLTDAGFTPKDIGDNDARKDFFGMMEYATEQVAALAKSAPKEFDKLVKDFEPAGRSVSAKAANMVQAYLLADPEE